MAWWMKKNLPMAPVVSRRGAGAGHHIGRRRRGLRRARHVCHLTARPVQSPPPPPQRDLLASQWMWLPPQPTALVVAVLTGVSAPGRGGVVCPSGGGDWRTPSDESFVGRSIIRLGWTHHRAVDHPAAKSWRRWGLSRGGRCSRHLIRWPKALICPWQSRGARLPMEGGRSTGRVRLGRVRHLPGRRRRGTLVVVVVWCGASTLRSPSWRLAGSMRRLPSPRRSVAPAGEREAG